MMNPDLFKNEEKVQTENGAFGYRTTGTKLLDLSFKIPTMRVMSNKGIDLWMTYFLDAFNNDPVNTLKFIFYTRDIRGGLGERSIFRNVMRNMDPDILYWILRYVPIQEFGRWDDLLEIGFSHGGEIKAKMFQLICKQLGEDLENDLNDKPVSLLAKWLPSERTSSKVSRKRAKEIANALNLSYKDYRKELSLLRKRIKIVESQMSSNKWDEIDYSAVPSKANLNYKEAFMRHDSERREKYLEDLATGKEKINASVLMPYEIVRDIIKALAEDGCNNGDIPTSITTLEELWKALPKPAIKKNVLVVRDGSGSMEWEHLNGNITPMDVGDSLTLYMAQNNTGAYKDKFITFGENPRLVDLSKFDTVHEKISVLRSKYTDCSNTNLEAVFRLVLDTVKANHVPQEEIPDILIISDMEFDPQIHVGFGSDPYDVLMDHIADVWNSKGYKLPKLVFWNVASRMNAIPMRQNDLGLILVSGFSTSLANMVLDNETDPLKALMKVLNSGRYSCVDKLFTDHPEAAYDKDYRAFRTAAGMD